MNFGNLSWGKTNRLAQIFKPGEKNKENYHTVMLAVDHSYFQGPTEGLVDPRKTILPLVSHADAISPARGTLEYCLDPKVSTPIILRVSGGNSILKREELSDEHIITSVEEALKLNAIGVSVSVYLDSPHQSQTIKNLGKLANEAGKYNLLVLGITAVGAKLEKMIKGESGKESDFDSARYFAHAGRVLQENGADIVKTYYCKGFSKVRESIQTPLVIAGGKKTSEKEALEYTWNCINEGADGVDMGRNIFQAWDPAAMIEAVKLVVHNNSSVNKAFNFYKEFSKRK